MMKYNTEYDKLSHYLDKAAAFDELAAMFYDRNFSAASKAEIELLMFSFYMDAMVKMYSDENGIVDYNMISDYDMARQLGVPQTRIRNLKVKKQVKYPVEFPWEKALLSIKDNIRYEEQTNKVIIPVSDPNLNIEIRNYIAKQGGYVDVESGSDYLKIRIDYYLMLMYYTMDEKEQGRFVEEMKKRFHQQNKQEKAFETKSKMQVANEVFSFARQGTGIIREIASIFKEQNPLAGILFNAISNMVIGKLHVEKGNRA